MFLSYSAPLKHNCVPLRLFDLLNTQVECSWMDAKYNKKAASDALPCNNKQIKNEDCKRSLAVILQD